MCIKAHTHLVFSNVPKDTKGQYKFLRNSTDCANPSKDPSRPKIIPLLPHVLAQCLNFCNQGFECLSEASKYIILPNNMILKPQCLNASQS